MIDNSPDSQLLYNYNADILVAKLLSKMTTDSSTDIQKGNYQVKTDYRTGIDIDVWDKLDEFSREVIDKHLKERIGLNIGDKQKYHPDNRPDLHEISSVCDARILSNAQSVACIMGRDDLDEWNSNELHLTPGVPNLFESVNFQYGKPPCIHEKFQEQLVPGLGTAFLVAPRVLATAAHNIKGKKDLCFVFGFELDSNTQANKPILKSHQVYEAQEVLYSPKEQEDWALILLDREVMDRPSLTLASSAIASGVQINSLNLYIIGHPMGLALKYAPEGHIVNNDDASSFEAQIDAYKGNSGSPIFNAQTHEVEAILIEGQKDWVDSTTQDCMQVNTYFSDTDRHRSYTEHCLRISVLKPYVEQILNKSLKAEDMININHRPLVHLVPSTGGGANDYVLNICIKVEDGWELAPAPVTPVSVVDAGESCLQLNYVLKQGTQPGSDLTIAYAINNWDVLSVAAYIVEVIEAVTDPVTGQEIPTSIGTVKVRTDQADTQYAGAGYAPHAYLTEVNNMAHLGVRVDLSSGEYLQPHPITANDFIRNGNQVTLELEVNTSTGSSGHIITNQLPGLNDTDEVSVTVKKNRQQKGKAKLHYKDRDDKDNPTIGRLSGSK